MELSQTLNDYLPTSVKGTEFPEASYERITTVDPKSKVTIQKDSPAEILADVSCPSQCSFIVNVYQFPGWSMVIDGYKQELLSAPHMPVYQFDVEQGNHSVRIWFENTPIRLVGNILTVIGIFALFMLMSSSGRKHKKGSDTEE